MQQFDYSIDPACENKRLDVFLSEVQTDISRSGVQKLIESGNVTVNDAPAKSKTKLKEGDAITMSVPDPEPMEVGAEDIPLSVVYEDADLIVIDKAPGMVIHPAPGHTHGTLVNALLHHCKDLKGIGGVERPGIVHRLDKDTSGLVLVAKTDAAHRALSQQFKDRVIKKTYLALVKGTLAAKTGTVDAAIGRHKTHRKKMALNEDGRDASTAYEVIEQFKHYAFVRAMPKTGRTHQIRVHLASMGHPILGDPLYGNPRGPDLPEMERQALHAHRLEFQHPTSGETQTFESPLPTDMGCHIPKKHSEHKNN